MALAPLRLLMVHVAHEATSYNLDLFVTARTLTQAMRLWRLYCSRNGWPHTIVSDDLVSVTIVPTMAKAQDVHEWCDIQHLTH